MPTSTYQVVHQQITVTGTGGNQTFRLTAPTGKKPLAGGHYDPNNASLGDWPDGNDWVWIFYAVGGDRTVEIYLVCAAV